MELNIWKLPPVQLNSKKKQMIPVNQVAQEEDDISSLNVYRTKLKTKLNFVHSMEVDGKTLLMVADQTPVVKCFDITSHMASDEVEVSTK